MLRQSGTVCNVVHINWLKPFEPSAKHLLPLRSSGLGLVVDASFEICGASRSIAYELCAASGCPVRALGLLDKTKCLCPPYQNKAPDAETIFATVKALLRENKA